MSRKNKSIAVLGLGKYGRSLADALYQMGADVLVADINEEVIRDFSDKSTQAVVADLANEEEVLSLGLQDMDVVVVAMGSSMAASIMCIAVAKEQEVPLVVAKAPTARAGVIFKKVGADRVIDPETESGKRSARILLSSSVLDFFEIDDNLDIVEIRVQPEWIGKDLVELKLRSRYGINVIAIKDAGGKWKYLDPDQQLTEDCSLLAAVENRDGHLFADKFI
ncbi:MAG: TrkA family potassium uptake protein [Lachnospiraceae bacterium]|nr:TrkA family potassium uptake protein [Lachnospiraceae bacterium]